MTNVTRPDLDALAELEDERRFLLRSLSDLEREHDAGDIDDGDYSTLRDGYTVRAAAVLREIDDGRSRLAPKRPRRLGRAALVTAAVVALSVGIGFVLASAWGERESGQEITGFTPGDDARLLLANARDAMNSGDFALANSLFARVVDMEREQGTDNVEAITYFGWTLALLSVGDPDTEAAGQRLDAARLALAQAIELDPDYADPYCFLAIVEFEFRDDATAALPYVERCEGSDPPAEIAVLIGGFADEIRAAVASG
jgi:tetratricopeptide (TPR) repeat protein